MRRISIKDRLPDKDCMALVTDVQHVTLADWTHRLAKVLGLESSKGQGINGSRVYDKFCKGCHTEIADYCMRIVEIVPRIYYRMSFASEVDKYRPRQAS